MVLRIETCPACKSADVRSLQSYGSIPAILFPIEAEKRRQVSHASLDASYCEQCSHMFMSVIDTDFVEQLYKDYYYLYPFKNLETMQAPYRKPFDLVADFFMKQESATLLEIGCEDAEQMSTFTEKSFECTSINPGAKPSDKIDFIDGFFGSTVVPGKFNYIVSRFNLEHAIDLDVWFDALEENLDDAGLVFVQVPNAEVFLKEGLLNIFAHEHPHYFCPSSLRALVNRRSFQVKYLSDAASPSIIAVICRESRAFDPPQLQRRARQRLDCVLNFIKDSSSQIVLYGASLSLSAILYESVLNEESMAKVSLVDDNEELYGRYMPGSDLCIESPDRIDADTTVILTLSEQYHKAVLAKLIHKGLAKEILGITRNGLTTYKSNRAA